MPQAYFITFRTYGTWLPGHEEGSVNRHRAVFGTPGIEPDAELVRASANELSCPPFTLSIPQRAAVDSAIHGVCEHRAWRMLALNVRSNHVHAVVSGSAAPEKMMNDFKSWSARRLREQRLIGADTRVWARHGSTRHLFFDDAVAGAVQYTMREQ